MSRSYNNVDDTYGEMHTLGAIVQQAINRRDAMTTQFVVKQERVVSIATTTFTPPEWMQFALKGEKINAIKALRDLAGKKVSYYDPNSGRYIDSEWVLGLKAAKDIVETITSALVTKNDAVG